MGCRLRYIAVGTGGIIGAILRFMISEWFLNNGNSPFMGTLFINLTGCFILGLLQGLARNFQLPEWVVMGFGTGLLGAFTTFSTFSTEVVTSFVQGQVYLPLIYMLTSSVGGYFCVSFGFLLANKEGA